MQTSSIFMSLSQTFSPHCMSKNSKRCFSLVTLSFLFSCSLDLSAPVGPAADILSSPTLFSPH